MLLLLFGRPAAGSGGSDDDDNSDSGGASAGAKTLLADCNGNTLRKRAKEQKLKIQDVRKYECGGGLAHNEKAAMHRPRKELETMAKRIEKKTSAAWQQ